MIDSILTSIKKNVGIPESHKDFDEDIITYINGVFSTLHDLGIGPVEGFFIEDDGTDWDEYLLGDVLLNDVKSYMTLKVRSLFDPPGTSYHISAMQEQLKEMEWRINARREGRVWPAASL